MNEKEIIRCVECDKEMTEDKFSKHENSNVHLLNKRVNYVKNTMDAIGITLKDLSKVLKKRERTNSKAGQLTLSLGVKQKTTMKC